MCADLGIINQPTAPTTAISTEFETELTFIIPDISNTTSLNIETSTTSTTVLRVRGSYSKRKGSSVAGRGGSRSRSHKRTANSSINPPNTPNPNTPPH